MSYDPTKLTYLADLPKPSDEEIAKAAAQFKISPNTPNYQRLVEDLQVDTLYSDQYVALVSTERGKAVLCASKDYEPVSNAVKALSHEEQTRLQPSIRYIEEHGVLSSPSVLEIGRR